MAINWPCSLINFHSNMCHAKYQVDPIISEKSVRGGVSLGLYGTFLSMGFVVLRVEWAITYQNDRIFDRKNIKYTNNDHIYCIMSYFEVFTKVFITSAVFDWMCWFCIHFEALSEPYSMKFPHQWLFQGSQSWCAWVMKNKILIFPKPLCINSFLGKFPWYTCTLV